MDNLYLHYSDAAPSIELAFFDATTGLARTDLVFNTAGLTLGYRRPGAGVVNLTLATLASATAAYAAGGFVHLAGGVYRLDLPTAANAAGVTGVSLLGVALPAGVGMRFCRVSLGPDNLTAASDTKETISTQVLGDLASTPGNAARLAIGASVDTAVADNFGAVLAAIAALPVSPTTTQIAEAAAIAVAGGADLRFDDTTGSSLVITRKSTSAVLATIPLRRADRAQPITGNG